MSAIFNSYSLKSYLVHYVSNILKNHLMKNVILLFVLALTYCTSLSAQVNWPRSSDYVYWGSPNLDQRQAFNYSLLQHNKNGNTFLNSPSVIWLRIRNSDIMDITKDRIRFFKANADRYKYVAYLYRR